MNTTASPVLYETITLLLPTWMTSILYYGDSTGLSLEEDDGKLSEEQIESVEEYLTSQGYYADPIESKDVGFMQPSFDSQIIYGEKLAGEFTEFTFPKRNY